MKRIASSAFIAAALALGVATPSHAVDPAIAVSSLSNFDKSVAATKANMMSDPAEALASAREAAGHAKSMEGRKGQLARVTSLWLEGEALTRLNKARAAQPVIETALKMVRKVAPQEKLHADLLKSRAAILGEVGRVEHALKSLHAAFAIYDRLGERRSQAIILHNIGAVYYDAHDYDRTLEYLAQAAKIYADDPALNLSAYNNRGNALRDMGRYEEAKLEYENALRTAREMESPLLETRVLTNLASSLFAQARYREADRIAVQGLKIAKRGGEDWEPFLWGTRAQIALAQNRNGAAKAYVERTFANVDPATSTLAYRDYHATAYKLYERLGLHPDALAHLKAFKRLDDDGRALAASTNAALLAAQFDDTNRELRISRLEAKQSQREMALSQSQSSLRYALLSLLLLALVIAGMVAAIISVRRRRREISEANRQLQHAATHDQLTGIANRDRFRSRCEDALDEATALGRQCGVMLIDLDRFKMVNDTLGHHVGDALLKRVAQKLGEAARGRAEPARLGGDEFALVISDTGGAQELVEMGERIIAALGEPHRIDGKTVNIGVTTGFAIGPTDADTVAGLLRCADLALYHGKKSGRGKCVQYREPMQIEADERHGLENDLRLALGNDEFTLAYQSIVDAETEDVIGYESLLRWDHPKRGAIPPDVFVPIAEDAALIGQIGSWVLNAACREAASWPANTRLAVNISALQVGSGNLANTIVEALATSGLEPHRLELEVTETVFAERHGNVDATLEELRSLGINLVLDDFGKGNSSLAYLRRVRFSAIKIDRSLVRAALTGSADAKAIVRAIVTMADELGMKTTAEGIEETGELAGIRELGCSQLQGYLFSRPGQMVEGKPVAGTPAAIKIPTGLLKAS